MLAMMHVLIRDHLVDTDWVEAHTIGFDELAAHVAEWTPERAAATCGVPAADIDHGSPRCTAPSGPRRSAP
jgi:anaerobic selenocysteine-containing dehydrogenase